MKISADQLDTKKLAGTTKDGEPVLYIATKGGLHAFFQKKDDGIISVSAAPHKAIAKWMAEKKLPDITWDKDFLDKSEDKLEKYDRNRYMSVRKVMFTAPHLIKGDPQHADHWLIYLVAKNEFHVADADDIKESIEKGEYDSLTLIRNLSFVEPVHVLGLHPQFRSMVRERYGKE